MVKNKAKQCFVSETKRHKRRENRDTSHNLSEIPITAVKIMLVLFCSFTLTEKILNIQEA